MKGDMANWWKGKTIALTKYKLHVCLCKFLIHNWLRCEIHGGKKYMLVLFLCSLLSFCFWPWLEVKQTSWAFGLSQYVCFMFVRI